MLHIRNIWTGRGALGAPEALAPGLAGGQTNQQLVATVMRVSPP